MKKCPKCHKVNNDSAKFCKYCGTNLQNVKPIQSYVHPKNIKHNKRISSRHNHNSNPKKVTVAQSVTDKNGNIHKQAFTKDAKQSTPMKHQPDYSQSWNQANQAMNTVSNYSSNYFIWLKDCLLHPFQNHYGSPYFGFLTLAIQAVFAILTLVIGSHSSEAIVDSLTDFNGSLPLQAYYENASNQNTPAVIILGTIFAFASFILVGYLAKLISNYRANFFKVSNQLASVTSINLIVLLLMLVSAIIGKDSFVDVFIYIDGVVNVIALVKVSLSKVSKIDSGYIATGALIIWYFIKGIIMTMLDLLL